MSLTIGGAIKQFLEGRGLGISVYRDVPPAKAALRNDDGTLKSPYCVVTEGIALPLDPLEDGAASTGVEQIQMDLYQQWRDASDKDVESPTLADAITEALHGSQLLAGAQTSPPKRVYGVFQKGRIRTVDRDARLVRHIYSLDVHRTI